MLDLQEACRRLGVASVSCLNFVDDPVFHLDTEDLGEQLCSVFAQQDYNAVFTHSPHGEYGHLNHMDVSFTVYKTLGDKIPVFSTSTLSFPEVEIRLTPEQYLRKCEILKIDVYGDEINDSWKDICFGPYEFFESLEWGEVEALYRLCTEGVEPEEDQIPRYRHILPFLKKGLI